VRIRLRNPSAKGGLRKNLTQLGKDARVTVIPVCRLSQNPGAVPEIAGETHRRFGRNPALAVQHKNENMHVSP
jgi:hypothetical protein